MFVCRVQPRILSELLSLLMHNHVAKMWGLESESRMWGA